MTKVTKASECKCCKCNKQAVAFYPCIDPDIPSYPYCADHLEEAIAIYRAKKAVKKYR